MDVNSSMNFLGQRKRNTEVQSTELQRRILSLLSSSSKNSFMLLQMLLHSRNIIHPVYAELDPRDTAGWKRKEKLACETISFPDFKHLPQKPGSRDLGPALVKERGTILLGK